MPQQSQRWHYPKSPLHLVEGSGLKVEKIVCYLLTFLGRSTRGNSSISIFSLKVNLGDSHSSNSPTIYASGSCNSPERINGGKNPNKKPPCKEMLWERHNSSKAFCRTCTPPANTLFLTSTFAPQRLPNTPKRIRLELASLKRSHQYCLKDMKKESKIKIEGKNFILVPKRYFLKLLQSLCISVLNTRKMLILQVATTLLVPPRDKPSAGLYHPHTVCNGLLNKNALAFAEVILALSEPPLRTHQCLGGVWSTALGAGTCNLPGRSRRKS